MSKKAVSLTLDEANLLWLKGLTERSGARSVSETVDRLITSARESGVAATASARSVVATIDIADTDPGLEQADAATRELFARSLSRPFLVKEERTSYRPSRRPRRG